jgi:hypothetical protein
MVPVYMSMQPEAQSPGTRPSFLARPNHGMSWLGSCLGRPGPINQVVTELPVASARAARSGPLENGRHGAGSMSGCGA